MNYLQKLVAQIFKIKTDPVIIKELIEQKTVSKPSGKRVSIPETEENSILGEFAKIDDNTRPEEILSFIPKIRKLSRINEDVGSVYNDLIQLTNTGHRIIFNQDIPADKVNAMLSHLKKVRKKWGSNKADINSLINKWIGQIWISGALSNEWVPRMDLKGIQNGCLVDPENIRFVYNKRTTFFEAHQLVRNRVVEKGVNNLIKLNPETYFYRGILNDTNTPYGIPPFLTALKSISTQENMKKNIDHILEQLGLLGYLEVKVAKPNKNERENDTAYERRLDKLLDDTKKNVSNGFSDGVVVGFDDDHEFEFHATTKNLSGVSEIFNQNQVQLANGLKSSPTFIGQKSNGTESNLGIVFTKMLSQLKNVQEIVASNLEFGYLLELRLAGFQIKESDLSVEFKTSTISDDLKLWQSKEIKQRVLKLLLIDGIIDQEGYAEGMGYDKAYSEKPLIPYEEQGKSSNGSKEDKEKDTKNKSARKTRSKEKNQPKRKDTNTKPS